MDKPLFKQLMLDGLTQFRLSELKKELSLPSKAAVVRYLASQEVEHHALPIATFERIMPEVPYSVAPALIFGLGGSGKSFTLDKFLDECRAKAIPFILFDVGAGHPQIPKAMQYIEFMGFKYMGLEPFRVILPEDASLRRTAMRQIIESLEREISTGRLAKYVLAFEEAYEFSDLRPFLKFLAKARMKVLMTVVVSVDPKPFESICRRMVPFPKPALVASSP